MMNIAPSRSNGFSWLARWNIHADSASLPMFFGGAADVGDVAADALVVAFEHLEVAVLFARVRDEQAAQREVFGVHLRRRARDPARPLDHLLAQVQQQQLVVVAREAPGLQLGDDRAPGAGASRSRSRRAPAGAPAARSPGCASSAPARAGRRATPRRRPAWQRDGPRAGSLADGGQLHVADDEPPALRDHDEDLLAGPDVAAVDQLFQQHEHRRRADVAARGRGWRTTSPRAAARRPPRSSSRMRVRKNCDE